MRVRVVVFAPDALTRDIANRIKTRFSAELSTIHCPRHEGVLGPLRQCQDHARGILPAIEVDPAIGTSDALIVGAPLMYGGLAPAMRSFLSHPNRIPPVLGVFATCGRRYPALGFETEIERLANAFGGPEHLILSQIDMEAAGRAMPRKMTAFLDRLAPTAGLSLTPVLLPVRAA